MSPFAFGIVEQRRVESNAVIPNNDGARLPLDAGVEVSAIGLVVIEELEEVVRFLLLEADDLTGDWYWLAQGTTVEMGARESYIAS